MPPSDHESDRRIRVLFAAGNGDVAGTLTLWSQRQHDLRVMSDAYSAQVYDLARRHGWRLFALPNHPCQPTRHGQICVLPFQKKPGSGLRYYLNELGYGRTLAAAARRLRADVILISTGMHPIGLLAAASGRTPIVLTLHNTFWTRSTPLPSGPAAIMTRAAARLARPGITSAVCVSEEIKRQAVAIGLTGASNTRVFVPQYDLSELPWSDSEPGVPRRILFAGRLEESKGVADLLHAARRLEDRHPGRFEWRFAGDGSFMDRARSLSAQLGVDPITRFLGQLDRPALTREIADCFITATPTRAQFPEGLAKLPLEGAACGKPALLSTAVPALDLLQDAAEPVPPSDPDAIAAAIARLDADQPLYDRRVAACRRVRSLLTEETTGFRATVEQAIHTALVATPRRSR